MSSADAQHHRHAIADDVHDLLEELRALLGGHDRKLAIGAADQKSVEAKLHRALEVARESDIVERAVGMERPDRDVEMLCSIVGA
jgi:hypothetical protein